MRVYLERLVRCYKATALVLLNALVMFLLLFMGAGLLYAVWDRITGFAGSNPISWQYGEDAVRAAYPGVDAAVLHEMLLETWAQSLIYEPFTQFRARPFTGRYVSVDPNGFRRTSPATTWPPDAGVINIFVYGGSTTFGYGVPDSQTTSAYLQAALERNAGTAVRVYNFGRAHYYSTQERILFQQHLMAGHRPDLAVFVDGLNDFYYAERTTLFTERIARYTDGSPGSRVTVAVAEWFGESSLARLLKTAARRTVGRDDTRDTAGARYDDPDVHGAVFQRYVDNKAMTEAAAGVHGVNTLFVWQPVPTYRYDDRHHPFVADGYGGHGYSRFGYPYFADRIANDSLRGNFLWLADIQDGLEETLYVDKVHYGPKLSRLLAEAIAAAVVERHLLQPRSIN